MEHEVAPRAPSDIGRIGILEPSGNCWYELDVAWVSSVLKLFEVMRIRPYPAFLLGQRRNPIAEGVLLGHRDRQDLLDFVICG